MADPCVIRLVVDGEVVMAAIHMANSLLAGIRTFGSITAPCLNGRFPTKSPGELSSYMGCEHKSREYGVLKFPQTGQTHSISSLREECDVTEISFIPASPL